MIEISHRQAQRLIRQRIDGPIPDEQWAVLQAHLEGCEECRAYQAGIQGSERSLKRVLRLRWSPVHGPRQALETTVRARRQKRAENRKLINYLGLASVIFILGMLYAGYRRATAPPPTPTPNLAALRYTPTPAPVRTTFTGVAAYVADEAGSPEIFLLNPGVGGEGSELVNMTNHPAADTFPAWSPDGEWLAFLSDRAASEGSEAGKSEVWVMHVSGSRLTQLTNDPTVQWRGPLSWSPDGAWIALTGIPVSAEAEQNEDAWVYLVPIGSEQRNAGPRKLGLTRGTSGAARFSPSDPMLAYHAASDPISGVMAYDLSTGRFLAISADDNASSLQTGMGTAFDWSDDGRLAYLAQGPIDAATGAFSADAGIQVRTTLSPAQFGGGLYNSSSNQTIESFSEPGALRQVAYVPGRGGREQTVAYLSDEEPDGCWTVNLHLALERDAQPRGMPGLCVDGPLSRQSFTPDGRWLVALGHLPGEVVTAVYALRLPVDLASSEEDVVERLAESPLTTYTGLNLQPVVRPVGDILGIAPRAAAEPAAVLPPAVPPGNARTQVVYSLIPGYLGYPLVTIFPNGSGARTIPADAQPDEDFYSCPAISPDGEQIAFLSDRETGVAGLTEIFVMDADGENVRRVARNIFARDKNPITGFECPVWSPDGTRLASLLRGERGERGDQLAVIPLTEDSAVTYLPVSATSMIVRPVWSPDGSQVLLTHFRDGQTPPRISIVDLGDAEDDSPTVRNLVESDGWGDVYGAAYSPSGAQIAYVVAYYRANLPTQFQLRLVDSSGENIRSLGQLPETRMSGAIASSALEWDDDNRLSFMVRGAMHDKVKSHLFQFDLNQLDAIGINTIAALDEVVFDYAWSPDRRWVMLATEAGLFAINAEEAGAGETAPAKISGDRVYQVDWR